MGKADNSIVIKRVIAIEHTFCFLENRLFFLFLSCTFFIFSIFFSRCFLSFVPSLCNRLPSSLSFFSFVFPYLFLFLYFHSAKFKQLLHCFHLDIHFHVYMTKTAFYLMTIRAAKMVVSSAIPIASAS